MSENLLAAILEIIPLYLKQQDILMLLSHLFLVLFTSLWLGMFLCSCWIWILRFPMTEGYYIYERSVNYLLLFQLIYFCT